ncbi:MAG: glycosyltransferase family 92 protein [Desulfovibrio sp.]|nr:glycosyltransferase family 92 protein [Desulfovibrio sp.]
MQYLALCCTVKDEAPFIKEWIAYHALLGVEHFIICDDVSALPVSSVLEGWAAPAAVTIIRHEEPKTQQQTYGECLARFGTRFCWIGFLDMDEFVRIGPPPSREADLRVFLSDYEPYAGLAMNWRMFSWNGHETRPDGLVMANYTACLGDDIHLKCFVRPRQVLHCANPHAFIVKQGSYMVDAGLIPVPNGYPFAPPQTESCAINHYYYKSRQCFAEKIRRGNPCRITRRMEDFERQTTLPTQADERLLPFVPAVRHAVAEGMPTAAMPMASTGQTRRAAPIDAIAAARDWLSPHSGMRNSPPAPPDRHDVKRALLCLTEAFADWEDEQNSQRADDVPGNENLAEIWTLRARAALILKKNDDAHRCLKQALAHAALPEAYALLAEIFLLRGEAEKARATLSMLSRESPKAV